ncbi:MAG: hypothetical protein QOI48_3640 [Solirubrobacteraceae bacterium]|jgi:hypothetical protein|nr:hypothetical protein [Solirubrobacteraceae bacterium]
MSHHAPVHRTHEVRLADRRAASLAPGTTPLPDEPALLRDPRLAQRRSETLRVALTRQAQQAYGNHAVGRVLARAPTEPATAPAVLHKTGEEVDALLAANAFFKKYVQQAVAGGRTAAGHLHMHPPEEFITLCVAYSKGRENPDTRRVFTDEEAAEYAKQTNAFQDGSEIHVNQQRGDAGTSIHEGIHLYANGTWLARVGRNVNEGVTEYLACKLCAEQGVPRGETHYVQQHNSAKKLVAAAGEATVADAYFNGALGVLESAVDDRDPANGMGTFAAWVHLMQGSRYAEADAML